MQWLTLAGICLLGAMSPGPSLVVVTSATLVGGPRNGFASACAHGLGVALYGTFTVAGLAVLITRSHAVFLALQLTGAMYLLWLGGKLLRGSPQHKATKIGDEGGATQSAVKQGFLVAFLNPKLAIFMLALFSQFLRPEFGIGEKMVMVATVGTIDALWYCSVVLFFSRAGLKERLINSSRIVDAVFGVILVALACSVFVSAISG